jgi:hypothetical protein
LRSSLFKINKKINDTFSDLRTIKRRFFAVPEIVKINFRGPYLDGNNCHDTVYKSKGTAVPYMEI